VTDESFSSAGGGTRTRMGLSLQRIFKSSMFDHNYAKLLAFFASLMCKCVNLCVSFERLRLVSNGPLSRLAGS
jgi:hypothetical protein